MTITDPITAPLPPYNLPDGVVSNITPFTYRDGQTYLQVLERLRCYITDTVVPYIDLEFGLLGAEFVAEVNTMITTVNAAIATQDAEVEQDIQELTDFVNSTVATMIAGGITVSDPVIHGVLSNPATASAADVKSAVVNGQGVTYSIPSGSTVAQAQAILTAAVSGSTVVFAPGTYTLGAGQSFTVANDGVSVDSRRATINSTVWGQPVFDFIGRSSITLRAGLVQFTGVRGAVGGATFRGSATYIGTCAVYINRDNCRVESLHAKGFVVGVYFAAWDGSTVNDRYSVNNYVGSVEIEQYNMGVLWVMQRGLEINGGYFHDDLDDSAGANPTHAVYGSSTTALRDTGVTLRNLRTENNITGQAYQAKYSDQLTVQNCRANNCSGVFNSIDSNDTVINGLTSIGDRMPTSGGSFSIQSTNSVSLRPRISNVNIVAIDGANFHPFQVICSDGIVSNVSCEVGYTGGSYSAGLSIYDIRGDRNRLVNISGRNRGAQVCNGLVINLVNGSAQGTIIENPVFKNVAYAFFIPTGVLDTDIQVNDNLQNYLTALVTASAGVIYTVSSIAASLSTMGEHATLAYLAKDTPTHAGANSAVQVKVRPSRDINVTNLYWYSVVASGNYDIAIYDDTNNNRLWSKGSTPFPAAGLVNETLVSPILMKGGRAYRITIAADNVVCSYRGVTGPVAGVDKLLAGGNNVTTVAAVFPLPDPLVAGASVVASFPLISVVGTKAVVV